MTLIKKIKKSKYHLLYTVLPVVMIAGGFKWLANYMDWMFLPKDLAIFFPSILTGIIFILGFLLAGIISDYKESEKIPNDMVTSLYILWQEAEYLKQVNGSKASAELLINLKKFIPVLKYEFFILKNDKILILLEDISSDIINIGKEGTVANYMVRLKTEAANLKRIIYRVSIIKNTDFIPSVFTSIQVIALIFLGAYSLLNTEPWWGGLIIICLFTTVIFSILILIRDLEDPFEYDHSGDLKTDEVNLDILDVLQKEFEEKKEG